MSGLVNKGWWTPFSLYTMLVRVKLEYRLLLWAQHNIYKPWISWGVKFPASQALLIKTHFRKCTWDRVSSEEVLHEGLPGNKPDPSLTTAHTNQTWQLLVVTCWSCCLSRGPVFLPQYYVHFIHLYPLIFLFLEGHSVQPGLQPLQDTRLITDTITEGITQEASQAWLSLQVKPEFFKPSRDYSPFLNSGFLENSPHVLFLWAGRSQTLRCKADGELIHQVSETWTQWEVWKPSI